ncbi:aspartate-semialdehyde dehydrogenase like protein [Verticillium longisporum]|nr:aspartate-semialdehyde dehydrogenase like protein [Verticillium longisporum]
MASFMRPAAMRQVATAARMAKAPVVRSAFVQPAIHNFTRATAFHTTSKRAILPPPPQVVLGGVNDPAPVPAPSPSHGSYHWTFERLLAAGLTEFLKANIPVFSNAKNHRRDPIVPLVVPTVNLSHLDLIPHQRKHHGLDKGFLVCNSNCAVIGLVIPFAALQARFGPVDQVSVVTLQAVSGAGYPGVSSLDILDNVVPYIPGEEDKLETEAQKILGTLATDGTAVNEQSALRVSATCTRVPVLDGHTACVSLRFARRPPPSADEVKDALRSYVSEAQTLGCPSAPQPAIEVFDAPDRPQPRLDRELGRGYTVSVGRVREDESGIFDVKFVALSHNTVIGAAGSSILNAEAAVLKGYI